MIANPIFRYDMDLGNAAEIDAPRNMSDRDNMDNNNDDEDSNACGDVYLNQGTLTLR